MKKLLIIGVVLFAAACSNPEDRATGNPDSSTFNTDEGKVLNSRPGATDPNSQSSVEGGDPSSSPATTDSNATSPTNGTNRPYGNGKDTTKK